MAQAGLAESFRGSNGGYRLARAASAISLIEIVEAIEGPVGMTECSGEHSTCELESHCGVRGNWRHVNDVVADALRNVSLAQMLGAPPHKDVQVAVHSLRSPRAQDAQERPPHRDAEALSAKKQIPLRLAGA